MYVTFFIEQTSPPHGDLVVRRGVLTRRVPLVLYYGALMCSLSLS